MHKEHVRLSRYICFVVYDTYVELYHSARDTCQQIPHDLHSDLCTYAGFSPLKKVHSNWLSNGTLVKFGDDYFEFHQGKKDSEASLARHYHQWYWKHEIESQREYRWLGQVAVKMPMDLFFYQELMFKNQVHSILELGYGKGGALHFFSSILQLMGRGFIVGVDLYPSEYKSSNMSLIPLLVNGDAYDQKTLIQVAQYCPYYDLIIIDLGGTNQLSLEVLPMWSELLAIGGIIVIEDLWGDNNESEITKKLDHFLNAHRNFELYQPASRYPFLKGVALIKRRD